jgi:hypothetical protein
VCAASTSLAEHAPGIEEDRMKIESTSFTSADYDLFVEGYLERERAELVSRLRRVAEETEALVPRLTEHVPSDADAWNPVETLAHMAVATQFFGWVIHEVSKGNEIGDQMQELMNLRDPSILETVQQSPAEIAQQLRDAIERAAEFLGAVPYEDLRNAISFGSKQLSAEDFTRLSMVHHLEDHVEQMRGGLAS